MNSISVKASTNCMYHPSSNIDSSNHNRSNSMEAITCIDYTNGDEQQKRITFTNSGKLKSKQMLMTNEMPLLSHLYLTHKFRSDSNLNLINN